jgi:hypothetical protein
MADRTREYNSGDWVVWAYRPEVNRFTLNFSRLDNAVLGDTGGLMYPYITSPTGISITEGSTVSQGIFLEATPTIANIEFSIDNFTKEISNDFFVGNEIWVTLENEESVEDSVYGYYTPIFIGNISSFNVQIEPGNNFGTISISAESKLAKALNTQIRVTKSTTLTKGEALNPAFSLAGIPISVAASDQYNYAKNGNEVKSVGDFMSDYLACETFGLSDHVYKPGSRYFGKINYGYAANIIYPNAAFYTPVGSLSDLEMTSMELDWSGLDSPTSVALTQYEDSEINYTVGLAGSGGFNYNATIDVKDISQMESVGQRYLSMFQSFEPITVTNTIAYKYQDITFKELSLLGNSGLEPHWLYPVNLYEVGEMIEIYTEKIGTYTFDDIVFGNLFQGIITGRTMEITPDSWTVTYNLWKGFTN